MKEKAYGGFCTNREYNWAGNSDKKSYKSISVSIIEREVWVAIPERVGSILEGSLEVAVGKVSKGRLDCVGRTFQT